METLIHDARYGVRSLVRMRGTAAVAIAALALGIAATTTMFSVVDATLWRLPPLPQAERLAILHLTVNTPREGLQRTRWSMPEILTLQRSVTSYESIASFTGASMAIQTPATSGQPSAVSLPEQIDGEIVAPDYFRVLRVPPARGRVFTKEEDVRPGGHPVAIISDALARRRYGAGQPDAVVGATLRVNDVALTIVGVMPPGFRGLSDKAEVWLPRMMAPLLTYSEYLTTPQHFIMVVARLKDGVTFTAANAELAAAAARFAVTPEGELAQWSAIARRIGDARADPIARRSAYALLGAAACVLLIACVNVASVLLARARTRQREIAVRLAVGSSRWRVVRQLLTEGLLIAAAAGAGGVVLALWGASFFARTTPAVIPSGRNDYSSLAAFATPSIDLRVLAFAVALAVATTLVFALAPALSATRPDLVPALKDSDRATSRRSFGSLVIVEVALAVLLLVTAGVLLESFARLQRLRAGFESERVLTFWVRPANSRYTPADGPAIVDKLLTRIEETPGVIAAAVNRCTPFTGCSRTTAFFPGRPVDRANAPIVGRHYTSPDYFRTLGIPLLSGRVLTAGDRAGTPPVTVISESTARRFWPGENPIGKRVWFGTTTGPFSDAAHAVEVVGVVGDVKYDADQNLHGDFYTSFRQFAYPDTMVIVKARGSASEIVSSLRAAVATVDPTLPIYDVLALDDRIDAAVARPRFNAAVTVAFAVAALLLAALGVYAVLSYSVSSRSREIGVRLALGADARRVIGLVLREGLVLAALGVAAGLAASTAAAMLLRQLLGAASADPRLLAAGATAVMLAVAALAALLPARRAARVDPMIVLRE